LEPQATDVPDLEAALRPPRAGADALPSGRFKHAPAEFQVREIPTVTPDGEGAHLWLELEREDMNTAYAAGLLARVAGIPVRDVGYAGIKDRYARTRQWFSVPSKRDDPDLAARLADEGLWVVTTARHGRKLRRGALAGNRFRILVRARDATSEAVAASAARIAAEGVPNYFGPQRFGHGAGNVEQARRMLCGGMRVRDRHRRGLYLSAGRSILFNMVLAARVRAGTWNRLLPGEAVALAGSASFFSAAEADEALVTRLHRFDVHPSGPLWGRGATPAKGEAAAVESAALARCQGLMAGLERAGLDQERRALRLVVADLEVLPEPGSGWWLDFSLGPGAYATVVLRELFDATDAAAATG
jgi:tRNA pseudouridine13 synthase